MNDLPVHGSTRRRLAIGTWAVFSGLFAALLVYGVVRWVSGPVQLPVLAGIGGIGGFVGVWRWIAEKTRA